MIVYLAGYETAYNSYKCILPRTNNLFLTYFYKQNTNKALRALKPEGHKGLITIDSGAHSFFGLMGISVTSSNADRQNSDLSKMPDPNEYFAVYKQWAKEHYHLFDYFCELDLQELLGMDKIRSWRKQLDDLGIADKCITVHHSSDTWEDFVRLCEESKSGYIAIEGLKKDKPMLPYNKFIKHAYQKGIKVHGFAFTKAQLLHSFAFYSVDSSSWTSSVRYGLFQAWDGNSMKSIKPTYDSFLKYKIPIKMHNSLRTKLDCATKISWQAEQYVKMEEYFTRYWNLRGVKWHE